MTSVGRWDVVGDWMRRNGYTEGESSPPWACAHCCDDPPHGHRCPRCGRVAADPFAATQTEGSGP